MTTGEEYLLVIGREVLQLSLIVELPPDYEAALSECEKGLHSLMLQAEDDALMIWDYPYEQDGKWVLFTGNSVPFTKELSIKKMQCLYGEGTCSFVRLDDLAGEIK